MVSHLLVSEAISWEVDGKLRIAAHAHPYVVDVCAIYTGRWGGRFDGFHLKMATLHFSMKKMTADSKSIA